MNPSRSNNRVITPAQTYQELIERSRELSRINAIGSLASWDQEVYMPPGGSASRAEMVSFAAELYHRKLTEPRFGELLKIAQSGKLSAGETANLRGGQSGQLVGGESRNRHHGQCGGSGQVAVAPAG